MRGGRFCSSPIPMLPLESSVEPWAGSDSTFVKEDIVKVTPGTSFDYPIWRYLLR